METSSSAQRLSPTSSDSGNLVAAVESIRATQEEATTQLIDATAKDNINAQGVRFISTELGSDSESGDYTHVLYGLPRELLRFLISLINSSETQYSEDMIHVGSALLDEALPSWTGVPSRKGMTIR